MIFKENNFETGRELNYDICIAGAGPAGITLALELGKSGKRICVLEAGGEKKCEKTNEEFYSGEVVGLKYNLLTSRFRCFGGTSHRWSGYCTPLDPLDFEKNSWIPNSGWPISYDDVIPYYKRAHLFLKLRPFEFRPEKWARRDSELIEFESDEIGSKIWHFQDIKFHKTYKKPLEKSRLIDVYLNSMLTGINLNETSNAVSHITVNTSESTAFSVKAKFYVLACGGLENARILLAQNLRDKSVFSNPNIGRFFLEHPHYFDCASIILFGKRSNSKLYMKSPPMTGEKMRVRAFFQINAELRRKLKLQNAVFRVDRPAEIAELNYDVRNLIGNLYAKSGSLQRASRLVIMSEQYPNPDSRVSLSGQKDKFGIPRIRLDWRLTKTEIDKIIDSARLLGIKAGQNGLGRLQLDDWLATGKIGDLIEGGDHHMGTTRMAAAPNDGVVDSNCKVHGLDNFYIAGSSVFPTSGCANPTFTILALAMRLSDHLKKLV